MGIVNVTPDSFSDGGEHLDTRTAIARAHQLIEDGADMIDLGAESTRPGATAVDEHEEWRRLKPVLTALAKIVPRHVCLSVDTSKLVIMDRAVDAGAKVINDVTGVSADPQSLERFAKLGIGYIAMHMHKTPQTMQLAPLGPEEAVRAVNHAFEEYARILKAAGYSDDHYWLDPGIGFGKGLSANLCILNQTPNWSKTYPIAIGVSRKSFIGRLTGIEIPKDRDPASKLFEIQQAAAGASLIRTHDVAGLARLRSQIAEGAT